MANDNGLKLLNLIRNAGSITRQDLSDSMEISLSLVNKIVGELFSEGLIQSTRSRDQRAGRPVDLLSLRPEAGFAVGIDIGKGKQMAVVADLCGNVIAEVEEPPEIMSEWEGMLEIIQRLTEEVIAAAGVAGALVAGVGISLRDIVDPVSGSFAGNLRGNGWWAWTGRSLKDDLLSLVPYPHVVVDDVVRALGTEESLHGLGSRDGDFVYLLIDESGVGMAFLQGGKPYIGSSHIAGELGHVPVSPEDLPCGCGSSGCLCTVVTSEAVRKRLKRYLDDTPAYSILRGRSTEVTIPEMLRAASEGDKPAITVLTEAGEYFGRAIAVVLNLFGPALIVVGGPLSQSRDFMEAARRIARLRALQAASRGVRIECSSLDDLSAARGAATMVINEAFESGEKNIIAIAEAAAARASSHG